MDKEKWRIDKEGGRRMDKEGGENGIGKGG